MTISFDPPYVQGPRDELINELRGAAVGWEHFGKPALAVEALSGVELLEQGEYSVRVGHQEYVVTEQ